ncbi:hypothetical protein [Aquipuribacter sp. SD81]|uniref:hypothetical protein n=1 Tax=Aquipuribacter sp. SD81 TaxID=3127703 RepID=UPI0030180E06
MTKLPAAAQKVAAADEVLPEAESVAAAVSGVFDDATSVLAALGWATRIGTGTSGPLLARVRAWREALDYVVEYPNAPGVRQFATKVADQLAAQLRAVASGMPENVAKQMRADADEVLRVAKTLAKPVASVVPHAKKAVKPYASLTDLERLAVAGKLGPASDRLVAAFREWHAALRSYALTGVDQFGNPQSLKAAGDSLATTIRSVLSGRKAAALAKQGVDVKPPGKYVDAIEVAVDTLRATQPTEAGVELRRAILRGLLQPPTPELGKVYRNVIAPAAAAHPHAWDKLCNVVAALPAVSKGDKDAADKIAGLIYKTLGHLGELAARASATYIRSYQDALRHSEMLVDVLNNIAFLKADKPKNWIPPFQLRLPQTDLRAPGVTGTGMPLFVDDAIAIVNTDTREAFLTFTAQMKGGDASSAGLFAQWVKDQIRHLTGRVRIETVDYVLLSEPWEQIAEITVVTRTFFGTTTQSTLSQLGDEIVVGTLPTTGDQLAAFAEWILTLAGRITP